MPFAIPQKWKWVPVNKIIELISGRDLDKSLIEEKASSSSVPYITGASQISNNDVLVNRWTNNGSVFSNSGDLLLTCKGTVGKLAINQIGICHIARQIMAIRPKDQISGDFAKIFFSAIGNKLTSNAKSMIPGISRNDVLSLLCPLPPIEEQQRIVAKLNELLSLVETYGKEQEALEKMEKEFPDKLRASLLQEAIQGKLVPQLESEPEVAQIGRAPENVPFAIPEKWKWVRLGVFVRVISGTSYRPQDTTSAGDGIRILRGGNVGQQYQLLTADNDVFVSKDLYSEDKQIRKGDIVIVASTGSKEAIGRPAFAEADINSQIGAFLRIIRCTNQDLLPFIQIIFMSDLYRGWIRSLAKGTNINNIKKSYIEDLFIPCPPVEEQHRIAAKINKLLGAVVQLENTISAT